MEYHYFQDLLDKMGGSVLKNSYQSNLSLMPALKTSLREIMPKMFCNVMENHHMSDYYCSNCETIFPVALKESKFLKHPCNVASRNFCDMMPISSQAFQIKYRELCSRCDRNQQEIALSIRKDERNTFLFGPGGKGKSYLLHILRLYYIQLYSYDQVNDCYLLYIHSESLIIFQMFLV